jgi:hypothetical protein
MITNNNSFQLVDPYARLGNTIRFEVLRKCAGQPPSQRLKVILEEALRGDRKIEQELKNVVYVVLNHPPLTLRGGKRHFVAAINSVHDHTATFLKGKATAAPLTTQEQNCEVLFLRPLANEPLILSAQELWIKQWNEYWNITEYGVARKGIYTWNHLLLKEGARPVPVGLCWDSNLGKKDQAPYFYLSKDIANRIGLACLSSPNWIEQLLALPANFIEEQVKEGADLLELKPLRSIFDEVDLHGSESRTLRSVAWKIFHLVRSYAVWGGAAFISIPIVIGTASISHTAVLSLCTLKPLSYRAYREWLLIAGVLLRPLLEEEMFGLIKQLDFAEAAYSIGHPLKNRIMPIAASLEALQRNVGLVTDNTIQQRLKHSVAQAKTSLYLLGDLGHILDVTSRCIRGQEREKVFLASGKHEWRNCAEPYRLVERLLAIVGRPLPPLCNPSVQVVFQPPNVDIIVRLWISEGTAGDSCRPSNLFYDEILQELVINAARHANTPLDLPVVMQVGVETIPALSKSETFPAVTISNKCAPLAGVNQLGLREGEWFLFDAGVKCTEGGLPILTTFMQVTGLGKGACVAQFVGGGSLDFR